MRAELRILLSDPRVRWIATALLLLVTASFLLALGRAEDVSAEARAERARWLNQSPKNPHSAAHYGIWAFKPSSPLATLDPGIEPYVGRMIRIEAHRANDPVFRTAQDLPSLARLGGGTVAGIIQLFAPLAAILLGFAAFAADRERGTLRLALGNGAVASQLLLARVGALLAILAVMVGLPLLSAGALSVATLGDDGWQAVARLLLWVSGQIGYAAVFLLIAALASLRAGNARNALAVSLLAWALLAVVAPRLATAGVELLAPTPSHAEMRARIEIAIKRYNRADAHQQRQNAILERYGVERPEDLPIDLRGAMLHDREQHDYAVYDREFGSFAAQLARQDRLQGLAGMLSPTVAVQAISQALAGSDFQRHTDFLTAAEAYRRVLSDTMNLNLMRHPPRDGKAHSGNRELWAKVPPFVYRPAPFQNSFASAVVPAGALLLWLVVLSVLATRTARSITA